MKNSFLIALKPIENLFTYTCEWKMDVRNRISIYSTCGCVRYLWLYKFQASVLVCVWSFFSVWWPSFLVVGGEASERESPLNWMIGFVWISILDFILWRIQAILQSSSVVLWLPAKQMENDSNKDFRGVRAYVCFGVCGTWSWTISIWYGIVFALNQLFQSSWQLLRFSKSISMYLI